MKSADDNGTTTTSDIPLIRIIDKGEVRVVPADAELPWEADEAKELAAYQRKSTLIQVKTFEC